MDRHVRKNFQQYKKELNRFAGNVSKMKPERINHELSKIDQLRIPRYEKDLVKGTIYKKLGPAQRRQLGNHFGNVTPGSNAALTTQAAQTAAATMAAQTMAATQAAQTAAATLAQPTAGVPAATVAAPTSIPPGAVPSTPGFQPAANTNVRLVGNQVVPNVNYADAAGALNQAKSALLNAGLQLQNMAAAQNVSGFGYRRRF